MSVFSADSKVLEPLHEAFYFSDDDIALSKKNEKASCCRLLTVLNSKSGEQAGIWISPETTFKSVQRRIAKGLGVRPEKQMLFSVYETPITTMHLLYSYVKTIAGGTVLLKERADSDESFSDDSANCSPQNLQLDQSEE